MPDELEEFIDPADHAAAIDRATAAERRLAIAEAGVPLNTPLGALFAAGYPGPVDDAAKITEAWAAVSPPAPAAEAPPEGGEEVPPLEQGTTEFERRQAIAAEGGGAPPLPEDPLDVIMREAAERGDKDTDIVRVRKGISKLFDAALAGDQRVMVPSRHGKREAEYVDPA